MITYDISVDNGAEICNLSTLGTESCEVTYEIEARSLNGTVAVQAIGTITFVSECNMIKVDAQDATPLGHWVLPTDLSVVMPAFYEVRGDKITFDLPWYEYSLPSGDNIFTTCGAKNY